MKRYEEFQSLAIKKLQLADHILTMTYPIIKDARLLLAVAENIFLSLTYAMTSILHYESFYKRIPPFPDTFSEKFNIFKESCVEKYKINKEVIKLIQDIKGLVILHKKSPIEFQKNGKFIICNESYNIKSISQDEMKDYMSKAKSFIKNTSAIIETNIRTHKELTNHLKK